MLPVVAVLVLYPGFDESVCAQQPAGWRDLACSCESNQFSGRYEWSDGTWEETIYDAELDGWVNRGTRYSLSNHYFSGDATLNSYRHDFGLDLVPENTTQHTGDDLEWEHAYNELFELIWACNCNINQW